MHRETVVPNVNVTDSPATKDWNLEKAEADFRYERRKAAAQKDWDLERAEADFRFQRRLKAAWEAVLSLDVDEEYLIDCGD